MRQYAEFFWTFTWRNIKLQYTNIWLGLFWGVLQPLLISSIFYVALKNRVGVDFDNYFLYIYAGLVLWNVFSGGLGSAHVSFLQNNLLVKNIYFPRFLLPLTFLAAKWVDLLIACCILIILIFLSDLEINLARFFLMTMLGLIQLLFVASGCYLIFSAVTVRYRGFQVIYPFINQVIFFTSPAVYDINVSIENEWLRLLFQLNPINGALTSFRLALFQEQGVSSVLPDTCYAVIIGLIGWLWFKKEDKFIVDRL